MVDSFEWVERFIRCFGSPNLIYAVEICGWHKDYAQALTYGRGIGAADYDNADAIVLWGHNPTRTWLAQATRIAQARKRGATVAVVDPKRGGAGESADLWLGNAKAVTELSQAQIVVQIGASLMAVRWGLRVVARSVAELRHRDVARRDD